MFVLMFSEKMAPFYQNIGSFPTLVFSVILGVCLIYWIFAVLGLIDLGFLDLDVDISAPNSAGSEFSVMDALAGLLARFGLFGVPIIVIISLIGLFGWIISYFLVHLFFGAFFDTFWRFPAGLVVLLLSAYCAAWITAFAIRPLRKLFENAYATHSQQLVGQTAIVRTSRVDEHFGEAILEDGGAGLILQVRSADEQILKQGDRVTVLEYESQHHFYRVILADRMSD